MRPMTRCDVFDSKGCSHTHMKTEFLDVIWI